MSLPVVTVYSRKAGPSWLLGRRIPMRANLFLRSHTMVYTYCLLLLLAHRSDGSFYALWFLPRAAFWCLFAPSFAHVRSQRGDIVVFPEYRNKHPVMWWPALHGFNKLTTQPNPPHSLKLGSIRAHLVRAPTIPLDGGSVIGRTSRLPGPAGIYLCGHEGGCHQQAGHVIHVSW